MNENIDLTAILKDCPKGWKLWSPLFGEVEFVECDILYQIVVSKEDKYFYFTSQGSFIFRIKYRFDGECVLFPSEDQRDWNKFTAPLYIKKDKFNPNTLKPFDKVLVRDENHQQWKCGFFSYIHKDANYPYITTNLGYVFCIPYNDDTKNLIGTINEAPEYYRHWEN